MQGKMIEVGSRLKRVRDSLGLIQREFAKPLGHTGPYISQLEKGSKAQPGVTIFFAIADYYKISMDYLFHGIGEMFLADKTPAEPEEREYLEEIENEDDLLWVMKRSKFFKDSIMGYAGKFKYEHDDFIKKSIRQYQKKHSTGMKD